MLSGRYLFIPFWWQKVKRPDEKNGQPKNHIKNAGLVLLQQTSFEGYLKQKF